MGDSQANPERDDAAEDRFERIKNVFRKLIDEADFLIDDKSLEMCE